MSGNRPYKRNILIVKKSLQLKFIVLIMAAVGTGVAIIAADMFTSLGKYLAEAGGDAVGLYDDTKYALLIKLTIYLGGVFFLALIVSHKVAGPVYRFEKSAEQVTQGDLTSRVFLRQGDELLELRDGFNAMVDGLRNKVSADASHVYRVRQLLAEALKDEGSVRGETAQKLKDALAESEKIGKSFRI
jgi:methyl-accepting chemotaxis protein